MCCIAAKEAHFKRIYFLMDKGKMSKISEYSASPYLYRQIRIISKTKTDLDPDPDEDQKLSCWPLGRTHATCHILSNESEYI